MAGIAAFTLCPRITVESIHQVSWLKTLPSLQKTLAWKWYYAVSAVVVKSWHHDNWWHTGFILNFCSQKGIFIANTVCRFQGRIGSCKSLKCSFIHVICLGNNRLSTSICKNMQVGRTFYRRWLPCFLFLDGSAQEFNCLSMPIFKMQWVNGLFFFGGSRFVVFL